MGDFVRGHHKKVVKSQQRGTATQRKKSLSDFHADDEDEREYQQSISRGNAGISRRGDDSDGFIVFRNVCMVFGVIVVITMFFKSMGA